MLFVFGEEPAPPAHTQEPQMLHTVPSTFDGNNDLISFLDEFEMKLESSEAHGLSESTEVEFSKYSKECEESINISSLDRGTFGGILTESKKKNFKIDPFKPQGPFPREPVTNRCFSLFILKQGRYKNIKTPWLCYSVILNKPYCHFCWFLADRQCQSYSSAWVNGVSVRGNFTQTIIDHKNSFQHLNSTLSYNSWLQGN
ncbi:DUF4371 domain-containing protein [Trichonephila clavipes]|nr:DUF4371 domain-containing protein [Trichonephila clavipes]